MNIHRWVLTFAFSNICFPFRLVVVATIVINKFYSDDYFLNSSVAQLAGMTLDELNMLEQEFLRILDYDVFITPDEYNQYLEGLNAFFTNDHQNEIIAVTNDI